MELCLPYFYNYKIIYVSLIKITISLVPVDSNSIKYLPYVNTLSFN